MRVLAITHSLGSNGAALCLCRLLVAIKAAGGSADVIYSGNEILAQYLRDHGVGVIEQATTANYDVALVNTLVDHARVREIAIALPVVFWVHEGPSTRDNGIRFAADWADAFKLSSRIVFDTPWQYQTVFKSFLDDVAPHRLLHVAPAIGLAGEAGLGRDALKSARSIVTVGSVYPRKRPGDLVQAVLRMETPEVHCTIVGALDWAHLNGPLMQQAIEQNPGLFTVTGVVSDEERTRYMRDAGVFCSAASDETFGMAAVEAASLGLALSLTDLPCYEGIWQHGVNALLAPVGAIDCISWNLKALTQDVALATRLGNEAKRTSARFTNERFMRGMSDALIQAIQDPANLPGQA